MLLRLSRTPDRPSNTDALLAAQMHELSVRERLSATVAMPAMLLTAWVHWQAVARLNVAAWLICMFLVQLTRLARADDAGARHGSLTAARRNEATWGATQAGSASFTG